MLLTGNSNEIIKVLKETGLEELTEKETKKLIEETSMIPVEACRNAIKETVSYVKKLKISTFVYTARENIDAVLCAAKELGPYLIAGHVNHTFNTEEALKVAKDLKRVGVIVEIISADLFGAKQVEATPEVMFALLKKGLVDNVIVNYNDFIIYRAVY